jgi:hypothetical protein
MFNLYIALRRVLGIFNNLLKFRNTYLCLCSHPSCLKLKENKLVGSYTYFLALFYRVKFNSDINPVIINLFLFDLLIVT